MHQFTLFIVAVASSAVVQSSEVAEQALRSASARALQGNAAEAVALLERVPASEFSEKDQVIRACMIDRFRADSERQSDAAVGVAGQALRLYRSYWKSSLLHPETREANEGTLEEGLRSLLNLPADAAWDAIEAELRARLQAEGGHVLMGRTPPLREFMLWRTENAEVRQVRLPEGQHAIKVKILDDFTSLGWAAYATCDRNFTGGWVRPEAIYAVGPGWKDKAAENYQVSFLAHETQHFADKERFGELKSWELEYRAKLAELALADTTQPRILSAFISNQGSDPAVPHPYANRIVVSWLAEELAVADPEALRNVAPAAIRQAAKSLLVRDSRARKRNGGTSPGA